MAGMMKGLASRGMGGILPMAMSGKNPLKSPMSAIGMVSPLAGMLMGSGSKTSAGAQANMADKMKAMKTPKMVTVWLALRPKRFPPSLVPKIPANIAPTSGANGTANSALADSVLLIRQFLFLAQPLRASSSCTSIVDLLRNNSTKIARPIADSAAATVKMKNTKTCPFMSLR